MHLGLLTLFSFNILQLLSADAFAAQCVPKHVEPGPACCQLAVLGEASAVSCVEVLHLISFKNNNNNKKNLPDKTNLILTLLFFLKLFLKNRKIGKFE